MPPATIRLFLIHGDPKRLRTAELSNWNGKALSGPRTEFNAVLAREESDRPGVYVLTGSDPATGRPEIYVGEAECVSKRVKSHKDKDFWSQITVFVSKDETLTKDHFRYLEGRLLSLAKAAGRSVIANTKSSGSKLSESDRNEMEVFLEKILQLLPVLGVDAFVPMAESTTPDAPKHRSPYCKIKGLTATGFRSASGFVVQSGSEAVGADRPSSKKWPWTRSLRQKLKEDGVLIPRGDHLAFSRDMEFPSPSAAAAVVHGGHANGLIAWKDKNGRSLKQLEAL